MEGELPPPYSGSRDTVINLFRIKTSAQDCAYDNSGKSIEFSDSANYINCGTTATPHMAAAGSRSRSFTFGPATYTARAYKKTTKEVATALTGETYRNAAKVHFFSEKVKLHSSCKFGIQNDTSSHTS